MTEPRGRRSSDPGGPSPTPPAPRPVRGRPRRRLHRPRARSSPAGSASGWPSTIAISFLLVIPIEPIYWLLAPLAGLLIGYYANQRSLTPRGAWRRILVNALYAGLVTGVTLVLLLLVVKALFFYADSGLPELQPGRRPGPADPAATARPGRTASTPATSPTVAGPQLEAAGVTDVASFTTLYWQQQFATAGLVLVLAVGRVGPRRRRLRGDPTEGRLTGRARGRPHAWGVPR